MAGGGGRNKERERKSIQSDGFTEELQIINKSMLVLFGDLQAQP